MAKCGMPTLMLKKTNAFPILQEAWSERYSSDQDLDRTKSKENSYYGINGMTSGKELAEYLISQADGYKVKDKNGHERSLRSDASIGMVGIIKPELDYISTLDREQQTKFLTDSLTCLNKILQKRGLELVSAAFHFDEMSPHLHYLAIDREYKLGKKVTLPFFNELNHTFPKMMKSKGWSLDELGGYDVSKAKSLTPDQLSKYKAERIAEKQTRKKSGLSSAQYKANQDILKAEKSVAFANQKLTELDLAEKELEVKVNKIEVKEQNVVAEQNRNRAEWNELDEFKRQLEERERVVAQREKSVENEVNERVISKTDEITKIVANEVSKQISMQWDWRTAVRTFAKDLNKIFHFDGLLGMAEDFIKKSSLVLSSLITKKVMHEVISEQPPELDPPVDDDINFGL